MIQFVNFALVFLFAVIVLLQVIDAGKRAGKGDDQW